MSDLTDRLRTCAAYIASRPHDAPMPTEHLLDDAADLLIEASNVLEMVPEPLGEPMEIIPPVTAKSKPPPDLPSNPVPRAVWTTNAGDLPPVPTGPPSKRPPRVCPQCDSRAHKRVFREGSKLFLACPVCAHAWEYRL